MKISRRAFLEISAALSLSACAPGFFLREKKASSSNFYIPSPRFYLNLDQNFSQQKYTRVLPAPSSRFPDKNRTHLTVVPSSLNGDFRLASLPGLAHSCLPLENQVLVVPTDGQHWLYSISPDSLQIVNFIETDEERNPFGGHAAAIPNSNLIAVSTNSKNVGAHDRISIREASSLKEVGSVSSYGFQAHDLRASADGKRLFVGHYGSILGSGPYHDMSEKDLKNLMKKKSAYSVSKYKNIYPASISEVELSSGKLISRFSSVDSGAHCHFAIGSGERLYLPHMPSLLKNRSDTQTHPWFNEGVHGSEKMEDFLPKMHAGFGTSIAYDEKFKEVLIPSRWVETLNFFSENEPDNFKLQDIKALLPEMEKTHGLAFHPNGKYYSITGDNWFATFERGSHALVPEHSFAAPLFVHAHTSVG